MMLIRAGFGFDRNKILLGDNYYRQPQNLARMDPLENPRGGTCPPGPPLKYVYGFWLKLGGRGQRGFQVPNLLMVIS